MIVVALFAIIFLTKSAKKKYRRNRQHPCKFISRIQRCC